MKTLGLSFFVAVGTLIAMAVVGLGFFVSGGGIIFPSIVAWVTGSLFALGRRPRHLWLQVASIGVLVAALIICISLLIRGCLRHHQATYAGGRM